MCVVACVRACGTVCIVFMCVSARLQGEWCPGQGAGHRTFRLVLYIAVCSRPSGRASGLNQSDSETLITAEMSQLEV